MLELSKILRCIECLANEKNQVEFFNYKNLYECENCKRTYRVEDNIVKFIDIIEPSDSLDKFKTRLKRFPRTFKFIAEIVAPGIPTFQYQVNRRVKKINTKNLLGLNIGSGSRKFGENVINVDIFPFKGVDILASIDNLPFKDNKFDFIICTEVLEHVKDSTAAVNELSRVLKDRGRVFITVPFIVGYHASPHDFQRFTESGLRNLMKNYQEIILEAHGPTGALLWILQEWCANILSFGNRKLHDLLVASFMLLTFPIKYIDLLLNLNPNKRNIASNFYFEGVLVKSKTFRTPINL